MKEDRQLYYTPPPDEIFDEVRARAIDIWRENGKLHPNYLKEKIDRILYINNIQDNLMVIFGMFDIFNQEKLSNKLSEKAKEEIRLRLIDGGADPLYYFFLF